MLQSARFHSTKPERSNVLLAPAKSTWIFFFWSLLDFVHVITLFHCLNQKTFFSLIKTICKVTEDYWLYCISHSLQKSFRRIKALNWGPELILIQFSWSIHGWKLKVVFDLFQCTLCCAAVRWAVRMALVCCDASLHTRVSQPLHQLWGHQAVIRSIYLLKLCDMKGLFVW